MGRESVEPKGVSQAVLGRLPVYLSYLKSQPLHFDASISATTIASALNMGEVQVRKDLAAVSGGGKPKVGYAASELINDLEDFLGYRNSEDAVVVGAGKLGLALLGYNGFIEYGFNIVAAFDANESIVSKSSDEKPIFHISKFDDLCRRMRIRIGIITVPAAAAQSVCDMMINSGILAIMNFAPTHLRVPENIALNNQNIAADLAILRKRLTEKISGEK
ncbi:MAG: redox-sensing transcriptional repressor Rex [Oscillospiraceae bacterium]|nr:redox-sensing transcriptional repressor Rex [Oscillospiraceae bacterium]